jgi:hypothetical protein
MSKTLADVLAANEALYVNCSSAACFHTAKMDVRALADRLGPDHGAMHDDLVKLFRCTKCDAEGRQQRPVFFTCIPDYRADMQRRNAKRWPVAGQSE